MEKNEPMHRGQGRVPAGRTTVPSTVPGFPRTHHAGTATEPAKPLLRIRAGRARNHDPKRACGHLAQNSLPAGIVVGRVARDNGEDARQRHLREPIEGDGWAMVKPGAWRSVTVGGV